MFESIRADMKRYEDLGGWHRRLGFWVTATCRFGFWADGMNRGTVRTALLAAHSLLCTPWLLFKGVYLPPRAKIGAGLRLPHPQNILMGAECEIGENCSLFHDVTLGRGGGKPRPPKLGNNVQVFAGAKILGDVVVGDNVEIGANAVVSRNVPSGSAVMVAPCRAVPIRTVLAFHGRSGERDKETEAPREVPT
ncbi:MAG: serine acetyltransferase [Gemmatimonadota bacterium]